MTKYEEFTMFIADLKQNKADIVAKLADAEDRVAMFQRELGSARAMLTAVDGKIVELKEQLKDNPLDIALSAEYGIWLVRKGEYGARLDSFRAGLEAATKDFEKLQKQNIALDPTPLAELAVVEMRETIAQKYKEYCLSINKIQEAKKAYLAVIHESNMLKYHGNNYVAAAQGVGRYAKINNLGQEVGFSTNPKQFVVTESDVIKL